MVAVMNSATLLETKTATPTHVVQMAMGRPRLTGGKSRAMMAGPQAAANIAPTPSMRRATIITAKLEAKTPMSEPIRIRARVMNAPLRRPIFMRTAPIGTEVKIATIEKIVMRSPPFTKESEPKEAMSSPMIGGTWYWASMAVKPTRYVQIIIAHARGRVMPLYSDISYPFVAKTERRWRKVLARLKGATFPVHERAARLRLVEPSRTGTCIPSLPARLR